MAASHGMHDYSRDLVGLFFGGLHYLSRPGRREIFGLHRLDRRYLLSDTGFARSACLCYVAPGDFDPYSGFSAPLGPAQTHCALDDSNLAVRVDHRGVCIFDALQMVSSRNVAMCQCAEDSALYSYNGRQHYLRHAKSCVRQLFDV